MVAGSPGQVYTMPLSAIGKRSLSVDHSNVRFSSVSLISGLVIFANLEVNIL